MTEEADDVRACQVKKTDFSNLLWSQVTEWINKNPEAQTIEIPESATQKKKGSGQLQHQAWPEDELDLLIKSKFPGAETYQIAAEKSVDDKCVGCFREDVFHLDAADWCLSQDKWQHPSAQDWLDYHEH